MKIIVNRIPFIGRLDHHMQEVVNGASIAFVMKLIGAGVAFVFNIMLARMIGADGTGLYYLALTVATIATIFGRMGLDNALLRFTAANASSGNWGAVKGVYQKGMTIALIASITSMLIVFSAAPWLAKEIFSKPELTAPLRWMSLSIVPVTLLFLHAEMLKGLKRIFNFSLVQGQNGVLISIFSLLGLYWLGKIWGVKGAVWAYIIAAGLTAFISYLLWKRAAPQIKGIKGSFNTAELFRSSMPLFWVASMNFIMNWVAIFFLGIWGTSEDVGIFSIASRTAMLTSFILLAVNSISAPKFAALYAKGDMESLGETARNSAKLMTLLVSPIVLIFVLFPSWVMSFFGTKFTDGANLLVILSIGHFVNVSAGSVGYLLMMCGYETLVRNITVYIAVINILLNVILVPFEGLIGAAIATAASVSLMNFLLVYFAWLRLKIWTIPLTW